MRLFDTNVSYTKCIHTCRNDYDYKSFKIAEYIYYTIWIIGLFYN